MKILLLIIDSMLLYISSMLLLVLGVCNVIESMELNAMNNFYFDMFGHSALKELYYIVIVSILIECAFAVMRRKYLEKLREKEGK